MHLIYLTLGALIVGTDADRFKQYKFDSLDEVHLPEQLEPKGKQRGILGGVSKDKIPLLPFVNGAPDDKPPHTPFYKKIQKAIPKFKSGKRLGGDSLSLPPTPSPAPKPSAFKGLLKKARKTLKRFPRNVKSHRATSDGGETSGNHQANTQEIEAPQLNGRGRLMNVQARRISSGSSNSVNSAADVSGSNNSISSRLGSLNPLARITKDTNDTEESGDDEKDNEDEEIAPQRPGGYDAEGNYHRRYLTKAAQKALRRMIKPHNPTAMSQEHDSEFDDDSDGMII